MPGLTSLNTRRGITVLALVLLIIALVVGGFFLVKYLRSRPAATSSSITDVIPSPFAALRTGSARDLKLYGSEIPRFARNDISAATS